MQNIWVIQDALSGDSGKGRVASIFAEQFDLHIKFNGGANAGHTVQINGISRKLHYLSAGALFGKTTLLGATTYIQPDKFLEEVKQVTAPVFISDRAHLVLPSDITLSRNKEQQTPTGTTSRGIGPCAGRKWSYAGIRVVDLNYLENFQEKLTEEDFAYLQTYKDLLLPYVVAAEKIFDQFYQSGANILFEGNQGLLLDVDWGTYPFVSASQMGLSAVYSSVNRYFDITKTILVLKAYISHLTPMKFPTEMLENEQEIVRGITKEYGTTTGRPRHLAWLDLKVLEQVGKQFPNVELFLTHGDSFEEIRTQLGYYKVGVGYQEGGSFPISLYEKKLPILQEVNSTTELINQIEQYSKLSVRYLSLGAEQNQYVKFN